MLHQPHNTLTLPVCLLCKFISPEVSIINLFANLGVFRVRLADLSNSWIFSSKSELGDLKKNLSFAGVNKNWPELTGQKPKRSKISRG